jgi:hypothetical protein
VSRRAQSYRFVHLTFEEYLAAWQLSNMDFDHVAELPGVLRKLKKLNRSVRPPLRLQRRNGFER